jgi:hypothetical protein
MPVGKCQRTFPEFVALPFGDARLEVLARPITPLGIGISIYEVADLDDAVAIDEAVRRFDITMEYACRGGPNSRSQGS